MKRKVIMLLLMTMTAAMLATGCKTNTNTSENTVTSEQSATENASIDLITEWEAKASVTLGDKVKIDGDGISQDGDVLTITEGGAYSFTGTSDQICILVDTEDDVKIVLNGVAMTNATGPVIYGKNSNSIYIETAEGTTNVLSDGSDYDTDDDGKAIGKATIFSKDDLIFLGSGSLEVTGNFKHGICSNDAIYFEGGTYDITASVKDGVHANDLITVDDGTFTIDAASDDMESESDFVMNGGSITGSSDDEGLESKNIMTINGGTIDLSIVDDGLNATSQIIINDGNIHITAYTGDAIDSNGAITINGGNIVAYGGAAPEGALDCDQQKILINGGTLVAVGDENSPISEDSEQASVLLGSYTKGSVIALLDASGNEVYSFTLEDSKSNIVLSVAGLTSGETYTVTVDGTEDQNFTVDSMVISAGGSVGTMGGGPMGGQDMNGDMGGGPQGDMSQNGDMPQMGQGGPAQGGGNMQPPQDAKTN